MSINKFGAKTQIKLFMAKGGKRMMTNSDVLYVIHV
jgi:hypothetical protein